ncbi:FkbM family methyltransferase [Mesorhizobium metallidurans]|uniref:FkbM family methyltransferase n=1 Tax=Mesorhizobium metallidurans TaxID=489722 RepID=UPI001FCB8FDD|nr:FkbM family methyltransferase [Mesorhizobium metallidurans]
MAGNPDEYVHRRNGPMAQLATKLARKTQQAADVLRTEGLGRFIQLSAWSLSEPLRSLWLRRRVGTDARQASSKLKAEGKRGLFIDCGSNIGQGYKYFSRYYTPDRYDYVLVEPNKNCLTHLHALRSENATMEIVVKAASVKDGHAELFGPPPDRSGPTHQGCSIVFGHNESLYQSLRFTPDLVETFSLSQMIRAKRELYDVVVLKLDVEGAEYEILDDMIRSGSHRDLYAAYVEFHSLTLHKSERRKKRVAESQIIYAFLKAGTRFSEWI